jgi:arylsulfatase A
MRDSIKRRDFLQIAAAGAAALAGPSLASSKSPEVGKPNIIMIFTDDQGYGDIGCFGAPLIETPHLDRMAQEGVKFTDFYSVSAICTPSRAGLLTGCYPPRVGLTSVLFPRDNTGLNPEEVTIPKTMKKAGYATACIGKWHLGHLPKFLPTSQGFDRYFGIPYSNDMSIDPNMRISKDVVWRENANAGNIEQFKSVNDKVPLLRDTEVVEFPCDQATLTKRYTEEALEFISENKERPFFLYLAHTMPHVPLFASPQFKGKSERGLYGDTIEEIDWSAGRIIAHLKKIGIDGNTLIVFATDNGPWLGKGKNGGSALPLRGGKFSTWEGGFRVPTIMRWPGKIPAGGVCREVAATIDMLPTFAHLAGASLPEGCRPDGKNIWPLMAGAAGARSPHETFYYYKGKTLEAARSGRWKVRLDELYDLENDIGETRNLAGEHPEIVQRIKASMRDFDQDLKSNSRPRGR